MPSDITKTGPVALRGLNRQNSNPSLEELPIGYFGKHSNRYVSPSEIPVGLQAAEVGYGNSQYDDAITSPNQFDEINEIRYNEQPWYDTLANGVAKMYGTFATTFLSSIIGIPYGIEEAIRQQRWSALWDNDVTQALGDADDWMEEHFTNYRSQKQQDSPWYDPSNLFSMNFIADDIIKNNGFMMGSVASMAVGSGEIGLLSKALGYVGDIGKIGKTTQNVVSSLFAATGEGMIEAKQGVRERNKAERLNVDNALTPQYNSLQMEDAEADEEYARTKGLDVRYDSAGRPMDMAYERYMQKKRDIQARRQELDNRKAAAYQQIEESGQEMGNTILLANQGLLTMGNLLQFSKGMTKSFDLARHAAQTSSKIAKPAFATVSRVSKNLADGYKIGGSKAAGRLWAGTKGFLTEGAEEMNQQFIQGASGAAFNEGDVNDYWKARLDPDAYRSTTESLYDFGTILDRGFKDSWGSIDQWEQFLVGGLTGAMGSYMPTKLFNQDKSKKLYDPRRYGEWQGGAINEVLDYNKQYNDLEGNVKDLNDILGQQDFSARVQRLAAHAYHEGNKTQAAENNDKKWWKDEDDKQAIHDIQSFLRAGRLGDLRAIYDQIGSEWSDEDIEGLKKATTREVTADEDKKKFDDAKDAEIAEIARQQDALQEQLDVMKDAGSSAADIGDISSRIAALEAEKARLNQEKDAYKGQRRFIGAFIGEDGEATMTNDKIREVMKHNSKELNRKIDSYLESVAAVNEDTGGRLSKEQEDNLAYLHNLGKESNRRFLKTISERRGDMPGKFLLKTKKTPEQLTKEYPVSDLAFAVNDDTPKGYVEADTSLMTDNDFANFFMREVMWGGNISPEYGETADEKAQREKEANDKTLSDEERKKRAMERFTAKLKEVEKQQEADRSEQQLTNVKRMKDIFVQNYRKNNNATVDEALKAWKELMQDVKDASDLLNQAGQYRATLSEYMSNPSKIDEDKKKEETKAEKKAKKEQTKGLSTRDLSNRDDLDDLLAQAQQDNDVDLINKIRKAKVLREKRANIDAAENDPNYSGLDPDDRDAAFDILRQQVENDIDDNGTYDHEMTIKELADKVSDVDDALVDDYVYNHAVVNIDPQTGAKTLSLKKDVINSTEEGQLAQFEAENPEEYNNQIELLKGKIRNAIKPIDDKIKSILSKIDVDDIDEEGTAKLSKYGDQIKEGEDLPNIEPEKKNDRNAPVQTVPNKEEVPAEKKPVDGIGEEAVITLDMQQSTENGMQTAFDGGQHPWFSVSGRVGYHTNEPYSATLKKLIDDPNISEEKKAQYRKQYKRAVAVEEFLERSGAYTRVENGGAPRKGRVKFKVFKSVNTKAEDFVIFMTDEQGRILGDLPSSDVDIDPNTERRTGLAELYEEARKQLEESGSDELELKGIESEIDFNYIGKPQYQEQRQHVNDLFGKNNFTIAIKVADSSSESPVSFLDTGKKSLQGKLEKDAIKAPLTGSLGQPYILIPTSQSGSKNNFGKGYWAVPIATPTFGEIDKDSVFYKTVRQTLEQIRDGKLSETEAKTKLGELFGLANFHVNFDSAESRKGAGIRATTYIRQDGSEKGAPHTLHVGDRASMDVDAILNELGRFFINVSNSKINSTGIYTVVDGTSYTYNQMIGEIATTNAAIPHTVNDWFTIKPVEKKGDKWVISETPTQRISYPTGGDNAIFNVSIPYQDGTSHLWTISPRDWVVRDEKGRAIYVGDSVHSDAEIAVAAVQIARAFGRYYLKDMTKPYVVQVGNQARLFDPKTNTFKTAKELEESPKYRKGTSFNSLEEEYDYLMSREAEMLEGFEMAARERAAAKRNKPFAELTPEEKGALLDRALIAEGINGKYEREPVVKDFVKALKEGKTQTTNLKKAEEQYNIEKNAEPTVSPQQIGQDMISHMQSAGIDIEVVDDASKAAEGIEDAQLLAIGEKGARSLDAAEEATTRMDNLAVANEMEKAGKGALTIKMATGWERGVDGKWRYEIPDITLKKDSLGMSEIEAFYGNEKYSAILRPIEEVFDLNSLPDSYREELEYVGEIRIYSDPLDAEKGSYITDGGKVIFTINLAPQGETVEEIMAHELQHYIQDREGFQPGGNTDISREAALRQKGLYDEYQELLSSSGEYSKLRQKILSEDAEYVKYEDIARRLDFLFDGINPDANEEEVDQFIKQEIPEWKKGVNYDDLAIKRKLKLLKEHKKELEEARQRDDENAKKLDKINAIIPGSYEAYRRLAGEVESRATSKRVGLSMDQRRYSLFTDDMYKDVAKEDLIFLENAVGATENDDINMLKVDGKILGFEHNGKLYLQKDALNPNLPMHEYTHLWDRVIKTVDPRLWKRGKEIMKSEAADLWKQIAEDENYGKRWEKEGKTAEELEDLIASEVHARLTGKGFEEYASKKKETFAKLKQWILDACKTIAKTLGMSDAEVEKLTLADWNNMTVRDFMEKSITMQTIQEEAQKAENIKQSEAIVAKIKSDSENYVLSDADGKENPQGAYYKDKRTNKLHARVTSVKEGDTRVQPFKETDDKGNKNPWILPSTTIGNAVDEFVRAFFAGEDPEASPLVQNLSESTKEGLRKELQKIKTSLGKWKVVSNGIVASGTIMVKDANGDKIAIRVAGTLDLLLYNPERNEYAIYDMKTHRSPVDNQKELDWAAQLSLYKQLLETKFPELRGKIKALKIVPFSTSGYNANRHHYESDDEGRLISNGEIVKAEVKYDGKTIDLTGKEMNLDISFARPGFKKEYVEGVQNIIVGKPQPKLGEAPKEKVKEGLVKTINKIEGKDSVKTFLKSDYKENPEALKLAEVLDKARADGTLGELCLTTGTMNLLQDMLDTKKIDRIAGYAALAKKGIEVQEEAALDVEVGEEPEEKSVDAIAEEKGIVTPATRNAWNRLTDENKQKIVQLKRGLNNVKKELRDCQRLGKDPNTAIRGYLHRKADESSGYTVIDMKKELEWLNRVLPRLPKENKVRVIEGLIKCSDGTWSYGQLKQGLIYIASNGKEGTMYHEAFHAVTQWILTDQELDRLYAAARERYGDLDTVTLEEKLADDFMLFTMGYEPSYKKRDLSILQRLWQALKNMFNNTSMIDTLYRDINDGVYANRVLRTENNEFAQIESEDRQVSMKYDFLDKEQKEKLRNNGVNQKQYEVMDTEEKRYLFHCVL